MKRLARNLHHTQTDAERLLWQYLRNRQLNGFKFRRQYWIQNYIVDFACLEQGLVVEIDGSQHSDGTVSAKDQIRTTFLENHGFKVLRFWNNEVLNNTESVLEGILSALQNTPHSDLFPHKGREEKVDDLKD